MRAKRRLTKIVSTIGRLHGPDYPSMLERFHDAGMNVARLNMSHCDPDYAKEREILRWLDGVGLPERGVRVATLGDLQGPKVRLGTLADGQAELPEGETVLVRAGEHSDDAGVLPIPPDLAPAVFAGISDRVLSTGAPVSLLLGDGEISLAVQCPRGLEARAIVSAGGVARSRMGFTPKGVDIAIDPFTDKDRVDLEFLVREGVTFVGVSFVRSAEDLRRLRYYIRDTLGVAKHVPLVAKIETAAAVQNIRAIIEAADGIMVARGDLGLQIELEDVPQVQKRIARLCRLAAKPVIIATQMLESMTFNPEPTRAEVSDVFNAILDGCDAVMLSGETSRGDRPERAIEVMHRIAMQAEVWRESNRLGSELDHMRIDLYEHHDHDREGRIHLINDEVSMAVAKLADGIGSDIIGAITTTGASARRIARFRSRVPVAAGGSDLNAMRELLLSYGVHPVLLADVDHDPNDEELHVRELSARLREIGWARRGDVLVVASSHAPWPRGGTNRVLVIEIP